MMVKKYGFKSSPKKLDKSNHFLRIRGQLREHVFHQRRGRQHHLDGVGQEHEGRRPEGDPNQFGYSQLHHSLSPPLKKYAWSNIAYAD
jgi:hypothetical protein